MLTIAEFKDLNQIHNGENSQVYRARRIQDQQSVILKVLKADYPTPDQLRRYRQEYYLAQQLQLPNVIQAYGLEEWQRTLVIRFEDFGAIALKQWLTQYPPGLPIDLFLSLAIKIANALGQLHRQSVIHKDINPANIVLNPETMALKLIDLGISTQLSREMPSLQPPNSLEGTLPYLSPEQTGRMNRELDYRTDFYSLGVTFYELLTGTLPFTSDDPMELVHCHLAMQPTSLLELKPGEIPPVLAEIVSKLMAKNAEDRYQSAWGLKADLEVCAEQWEKTGAIGFAVSERIAEFPLGRQDVSAQFQIPQKLYGREQEIAGLLAAFERVAGEEREKVESQSALILVTGYSGIGKSALVRSLYKPITARRGYFISGKFDQFQRNIPYSAVVDAFAGLVKQLLGEPDSVLQQWRARLLAALGTNGQVVIDGIPEVELLIGQQPSVPELGASEAQNRFNLVFQRFIQACCSPDHPLVLFLDDVQWADLATLNLLERFLGDGQIENLLFIAAYRDNEVTTGHPLSLTIAQLQQKGVNLEQITLVPLPVEQIEQLIAEALHREPLAVTGLAELVLHKTGGNPFFINQFLKTLYNENLLTFNFGVNQWEWDLEQIERMGFTDNVVELMVVQLQKLPPSVQEILTTAAYLGTEFDLKTLGLIKNQPAREIFADLKLAMEPGFVVARSPLDENLLIQDYEFGHDRIQQAAYSLIPELERARTHYQIGQLLLQDGSDATREEQIFSIVNHLNHGMALIVDPSEHNRLAELNLYASQKARSATAYPTAHEYAAIGLNLLGSTAWKQQYEMTLQLHKLAAEAAALSGEFDRMDQWIDAVIQHTQTPLEQVSVYIVKIQVLVAQNQFSEAIVKGRSILKQFGVEFVDQPTPAEIQQAMQEINTLMGTRFIAALFDLPAMVDTEKLSIIEIAAALVPACFLIGSPLLPMMIILQVKLSIQYGNSPTSAISYSAYSMLLLNAFQDVATADPFSRLAYRLGAAADFKQVRAHTFLIVGAQTHHRTSHIRETLPILQAAYQAGLEMGQLEYVGHVGHQLCLMSFWSGQPLWELEPQMWAYRQQLLSLNQLTTANFCSIYWETAIALSGNLDKIELMFDQIEAEEKLVAQALASNDMFRLLMFYIHKAMVRFLERDVVQANAAAVQAKQYLTAGGGAGTICEGGLYFYDSLIALSMVSANAAKLEEQQERVQQNQAKLHYWASYAPMNHQHKWQLVEAERHRVLGQKLEAIELYDQAITAAKAQKYMQEEALANELAALFYLNWGKEKVAQVYLQEAHYGYSRWGATAKVHQLETEYPQFFDSERLVGKQSPRLPSPHRFLSTSPPRSSAALDLATVMKASQAIACEIVLENLLQTLMNILLENAGAQTGCLLLPTSTNSGSAGILSVAIYSNTNTTILSPTQPIHQILPESVLQYSVRTGESVVLDHATQSGSFVYDPYIQSANPLSILCYPLRNQGELVGIVYLENKVATGAFTRNRIEFLQLLSGQIAIALTNAQLYAQEKEKSQALQRINSIMLAQQEAELDGILIIDENRKVVSYNRRFVEIWGLPEHVVNTGEDQAMLGFVLNQLSDPEEFLSTVEYLYKHPNKKHQTDLSLKDGRVIERYSGPVIAQTGYHYGRIWCFRDISDRKRVETILADYNRALEQQVAERTTELQRANQELSRLATLDGLTKIANRRRFDDYLAAEWQRHKREQQPLALILIDIDYFKRYNDRYGHQGGDECLIRVAHTIAQVPQRPTDLVARYGGEEFAAILPNTTLEGGLAVAEAMQQAIVALALPHAQSEVSPFVTLSIGVAVLIPTPDTHPDDLIARTDAALYAAKQQGRNQSIGYTAHEAS